MKHALRQLSLAQTPAPHAAPSGRDVYARRLVVGWQLRHGFIGSASPLNTRPPSTKQPTRHVPWLHTLSIAHCVPSAASEYCEVETSGWQRLQGFAGSSAPAMTSAPAMKQVLRQAPWAHSLPLPHDVPSGCATKPSTFVVGAQRRQALSGSTAPLASTLPLMKQPAVQAEPLHTCPTPQAVPSGSAVNAAVVTSGAQTRQALVALGAPASTTRMSTTH